MRCRYPSPLKVVRFVENFPLFNQLNVSRADIPCVLGNGIAGAPRPTQSVTLYISIHITSPSPHNSQTVRGDSHTEDATIPGRIQLPVSEHVLPLSHHQAVETGNTMPQIREDVSHTNTTDPHLAVLLADESIKRIVLIDGSNTWEKAVKRVKWVMDTLGPIAEVRVIPFGVFGRANLHAQLSPFAKMAHGLLLAIPRARPVLSYSERDAHAIFVSIIDAP